MIMTHISMTATFVCTHIYKNWRRNSHHCNHPISN